MFSKTRDLDAHVGQDIVIHTTEGPSLRGVLHATDGLGVRLISAKHLDDDADLSGQVGVPWQRVWFFQLLPPGDG